METDHRVDCCAPRPLRDKLLFWLLRCAGCLCPGRDRAQHNYTENMRHEPQDDLVQDQTDWPMLRYGIADVARCGCGPVAVYNAMLQKGRRVSLAAVLRCAEQSGGMMLAGRMGTDPFRMGKLLARCGLLSVQLDSPAAAQAAGTPGCYLIVSQWNDAAKLTKGAHTYLVRQDAQGYTAWNRAPGGKTVQCADWPALLGKGRFITAYKLM